MLCDNLGGGVGDGREAQEGTYVYPWLILADGWQKPAQYCKQLSSNLKKKKQTNLRMHIWMIIYEEK